MVDLEYPHSYGGLLRGYWDATDGQTVKRDGSNKCHTVFNKSQYNNPLIQEASISLPTWNPIGFNGNGCLEFDGSTSCLVTRSNLLLADTDEITIIISHINNTSSVVNGGAKILCELSPNMNTPDDSFYVAYERNDGPTVNGLMSALKGNSGLNGTSNNNYFTGVTQNLIVTMDKGSANPEVKLYQNGTQLTKNGGFNSNNSNNFGNRLFYVGARNQNSLFFNGSIALIMVIAKVLSSDELVSMSRFLGNKLRLAST